MDLIERPLFNLIDRIVLIYNATITAHIIISIPRLPNWPFLLSVHLLIFIVIWLIAKNDREKTGAFYPWIHTWYPLMLLLWYYPETGMLRHTVIPYDLDELLTSWETTFFPQRFYFTIPLTLSIPVLEVLHAFYFGYYLIFFLPALIAYKRQKSMVKEYIFVVTMTMLIHYWFVILFPASGPVPLRKEIIPDGVFFIPLMNFLYANIDQGGAAFPSTHAAAAVIASWYAIKFYPQATWFYTITLITILISTVLCSFHYTIDTVAGILTGIGCYHLGKKIYTAYG